MLYTEDTRIAALAVHIVGNKAKAAPLLVSPALSGQVGATGRHIHMDVVTGS